MSYTHTLIFTAASDPEYDRDYAIECPGVTDACRAWEECQAVDCPSRTHSSLFEDGEVPHTAHGQEHRYIDMAWMTATDRCYLAGHDELPDAAEWLARKQGIQPGRYEVFHSFDDGSIEYLELASGGAS